MGHLHINTTVHPSWPQFCSCCQCTCSLWRGWPLSLSLPCHFGMSCMSLSNFLFFQRTKIYYFRKEIHRMLVFTIASTTVYQTFCLNLSSTFVFIDSSNCTIRFVLCYSFQSTQHTTFLMIQNLPHSFYAPISKNQTKK